MVAPGVEHADGLRALAGKDECERFHVSDCRRASEVEQGRAPGEAAADAFEHQRVALADLAVAHRRVERERDRRGRRVAVLVDGNDELVERQLQLLRRALHDPVLGSYRQAAQLGSDNKPPLLAKYTNQFGDSLVVARSWRIGKSITNNGKMMLLK